MAEAILFNTRSSKPMKIQELDGYSIDFVQRNAKKQNFLKIVKSKPTPRAPDKWIRRHFQAFIMALSFSCF